jgi:hypothetical protein
MIVIKTLTTGQIPTRTNKSTGGGIDPMIVIKTLTTGQIPTRANKSMMTVSIIPNVLSLIFIVLVH